MPRDAATADISAIRDTIRSSSDPRVLATRSRLYEAVRALADSGAEITVRSVTVSAGVSRATFYTHFSGVEDLALHLQEQAFHDIAGSARSTDSVTSFDETAMARSQRALIAHYAAYRSLICRRLRRRDAPGAESRVAALMRTEILAHIRDIAPPPPGVDPEIAATYIAHAATGLIASWVLGETEATEDELAQHLTQLMPRWMHTGIPSSAGDPDGL
ncbi:TetR/AcrR family transcriptional regulator [Microbacterium sp. Se63.02b]|uniref:TetR/AcrR family transcriptional regulator n=1 Tax=Microbacterium sp. Se63.02b TaxID=2709304 RepID=UPI001604BA3C|nr:TetR/AcrR family transcriptional regulator [Microbacterium sp. Se63.02b]QNA91537.1 TetR/AcrR family transcriptional regulator [Microbacterium sp. Se63.02b]